MRRTAIVILVAGAFGAAQAQLPDATSLYGIHWYGNPGDESLAVNPTDAEEMADGHPMWVMEITHVDEDDAPAWDQPWFFVNHAGRVTGNDKNHSLVFRIQPYWARNVPHPDDPYSLADFANDARAAADTLKDYVRFWQVGNEVNLTIENNRWGGSEYNVIWTPSPEQYAETYEAVRNAMHDITPNLAVPEQVVLMQPVGPGLDRGEPIRYMDGVEFLWRQIEGVSDPDLIDGFALHGYAQPGGTNFGADGYMKSIQEQLMVIDQLGLSDRPVLITEFNKHMPNSHEAQIGARFVQRAYQRMHEWNTSTGTVWPGQPNNNIVSAIWFVYPRGGWDDYSLLRWKEDIASTDPDVNPWYGFQAAAQQDYPAGSMTLGPVVDMGALWWEDDFSTLSTSSPPPAWTQNTIPNATVTPTDEGLQLRGTGGTGSATVYSEGLVYGNFRLEADFTFDDGRMVNTGVGESNFEIRFREGSNGYAVTFYPEQSGQHPGQVRLRRVNNWSESIDGLAENIGIADGDSFHVAVVATSDEIDIKVYKNGSATPAVDWTTTDGEQNVGWVRAGTYNMRGATLHRMAIGGPEWGGTLASVDNWMIH